MPDSEFQILGTLFKKVYTSTMDEYNTINPHKRAKALVNAFVSLTTA